MNLAVLCLTGIALAAMKPDVLFAASKSLYVAQLDGAVSDVNVRDALVRELKHVAHFKIANAPDGAALVLTGTNRIRIRGYVSLNPRSGILPSEGQAVYGGYISVELKDRTGETVWSYLAVPGSGTNALDAMAKQIAKHLVSALTKGK